MVKSQTEPLCVTRARLSLDSYRVQQAVDLAMWPTSELRIHSSQSSFEVEIAKEYPPISLSSPDSSDRRPRKVRFSGQNETFLVINRREISSTERRQAWYRKSELRHANRRQDDLGPFDDNVFGGESDFCLWENQLMNSSNDEMLQCHRSFHRLLTISSVLDEQDYQKKRGIGDPLLVSKRYSDAIHRSRQALFIAILSAQEKEQKRLNTIKREAFLEANSGIRLPKKIVSEMRSCPILYGKNPIA
jgi:hypothetical protein